MVTLQWIHITFIAGLVIAWTGFFLGIVRMLLSRVIRDLDARMEQLAQAACSPSNCAELKRVASDLTQLRVELPVAYVRREDSFRENAVVLARLDALATAQQQFVLREDHIRSETVMHAKMDALAERIERLMEVVRK